jgi:hypothetical protein
LQADQSDVQPGDHLIAVDAYNVSSAPAKAVTRMLSSLPWPRVLVFQTKALR